MEKIWPSAAHAALELKISGVRRLFHARPASNDEVLSKTGIMCQLWRSDDYHGHASIEQANHLEVPKNSRSSSIDWANELNSLDTDQHSFIQWYWVIKWITTTAAQKWNCSTLLDQTKWETATAIQWSGYTATQHCETTAPQYHGTRGMLLLRHLKEPFAWNYEFHAGHLWLLVKNSHVASWRSGYGTQPNDL